MKTGTCKYSHTDTDWRGTGKEIRCRNSAYEDGMCKFHLAGYLDASTAGEIRDLFWKQHDKTADASLLNCNGYVLPSLAIEGGPQVIRRQVCLDNAMFGSDGADLSGLTFEQPASFRAAKFKGGVNFQYCAFEKGADFSHAEFLGAAKFEGSRFNEYTRFSRAAFVVTPKSFCNVRFRTGWEALP